jgi:hypothetical protein
MVNGVIWTLTAMATIFLALRLYCKQKTGKRLLVDDWFLIGAWVSQNSSTMRIIGGQETAQELIYGLT